MLVQLKHNLLVSWRNFGRYKGSFFINLIGLSTGIAAALLIFFWVQSELSMNKFSQNDKQLYQIMENRVFADRIVTAESTSAPLAGTLNEEFPEVEKAVTVARAQYFPKTTLVVGDQKIKAAGQYASKDYFQIFTYHLLQGDAVNALNKINSIALSEELAKKLFQSADQAIGRQVLLQKTQAQPFLVSAVFKAPINSSESFDFILPFDALLAEMPEIMRWSNTAPNTYVTLKAGTDVKHFNTRIADLVKRKSDANHRTLFAVHYSDNYLYGKYENGVQSGGRIEYIRLLSAIALFMLLIAAINFMNLATARASRRIKEIGVKKAIGATQRSLITQFLTESFFMTFLAFMVAMVLIFLLIHPFNQLTGKHLMFSFSPEQSLCIFGALILLSLVAGSYPAIYLSHLNTLQTLKGKLQHHFGELFARKGLVVFQFTLSVILMIGVIVVYKQIDYIQTTNMGYNRDQVVMFEHEESIPLNSLVNDIKTLPGVRAVSAMSHTLTGHEGGTKGIDWEGKDPNHTTEFENVAVYYRLPETLGMKMKEGRFYSQSYSTDSSKIIFNEAAIRFMGLKDPVGKTIKLFGENRQIIGVMQDFHFESLHEKIKPLFMLLEEQEPNTLMVKIESGKTPQALQGLKKVYQRYNPGTTFDYQFMDDIYTTQYQSEIRVSTLSRYFAALAIMISCLGLFGLISFAVERRKKEISIRKVLGASVSHLSILLSKEFLGLVLLAICIAFPIAWYLSYDWLSGFAYHITIRWWIFALAASSALLITLLIVSFQALKTALANPVDSLRNE